MKKIVLHILTIFFCITALTQSDASTSVNETKNEDKENSKTHFYNFDDKRIPVRITEYGKRRDIVMISLHNDETTSVQVAKNVLEQSGGILIELENEGERLVSFMKDGKSYQFDPNRMFSYAGLQENMRKLNKKFTKSAINKAIDFGKFLLKLIPAKTKTIIALHNNDDGKYSVNDYKAGQYLARDRAAISIQRSLDPDDFFLTTDLKLYNGLKKKGFNVILQNNAKARDDGSLSIYYGRRKKAYINIEAQHEHQTEQMDMLLSLIGYL